MVTLVTIPLLDIVMIHRIFDSAKKHFPGFWVGASTLSEVGVGDEVQIVSAGRKRVKVMYMERADVEVSVLVVLVV